VLQTPYGDVGDYDEAAAFITTVTSITQWVMQILAWPDPQGPFNISDESPPGVWAMIWLNYAAFWAMPLVALAFGPPSKGRFGGNTQSLLNTLVGGIALIAGFVEVFRGTPDVVNAATAVDTMISPLGTLLNWLLVDFIRQDIWDSSDFVFDPAVLVLIVDLVINLAAPILYRVSLTKSE
jgi:hypothetical protein